MSMTNSRLSILRLLCALLLPFAAGGATGATYHVDARDGDDARDGLSPQTAWRSLEKASQHPYAPGDRLLLRRGGVFPGKIHLQKVTGAAGQPIVIDAYAGADASTARPIIDAKGYLAGLHLVDCAHIEAANLEITADAGESKEAEADVKRYGVFVQATSGPEREHVYLRSLRVHDIFATQQVASDGKNATSNRAVGIEFMSGGADAPFLKDILIENCEIERTGFTGIGVHSSNQDVARFNDGVRILNNTLRQIGGPGMQPGRSRNILVRGNLVDGSGSSADPRMHMRGSGIWPWTCQDVLIERNAFMHARGKADSCGVHIDFNCSRVVVQHNLSLDNAGGFVEILGNNFNCSYRYNISIDDGFRLKGQEGAHQEGKTLWFSGFSGKNPRTGPTHSYVYNNTIFVKAGIRAAFSIAPSTDGALVANNIFVIQGETANVLDDQEAAQKKKKAAPAGKFKNVIFSNNLITTELPRNILTRNDNPLTGDPQLRNPGGFHPADYAPANADAVRGKGVAITKLPGDEIGLAIGFAVDTDFFGNPIKPGAPDLGAIVFGGQTDQLPAGFPPLPRQK